MRMKKSAFLVYASAHIVDAVPHIIYIIQIILRKANDVLLAFSCYFCRSVCVSLSLARSPALSECVCVFLFMYAFYGCRFSFYLFFANKGAQKLPTHKSRCECVSIVCMCAWKKSESAS